MAMQSSVVRTRLTGVLGESLERAVRRLGDFLYACGLHDSTSTIGQAVAADNGAAGFATTFCSCIEGVVRLYELYDETGDGRYVRLAKGIAGLLPEAFEGFHSHGRMSALQGMVDLAVVTRDEALLARIERQWQVIQDEHVTVLGGIREHFGYGCVRDEGCSVADWVMLSLQGLRTVHTIARRAWGALTAAQRGSWGKGAGGACERVRRGRGDSRRRRRWRCRRRRAGRRG